MHDKKSISNKKRDEVFFKFKVIVSEIRQKSVWVINFVISLASPAPCPCPPPLQTEASLSFPLNFWDVKVSARGFIWMSLWAWCVYCVGSCAKEKHTTLDLHAYTIDECGWIMSCLIFTLLGQIMRKIMCFVSLFPSGKWVCGCVDVENELQTPAWSNCVLELHCNTLQHTATHCNTL